LESAQGGERKTSNRIGIANIRESEKRMERGEEIQKKKKSVQFAPELPLRLIIHFFSLFLRASTRKKSAAYKLRGEVGRSLSNEPNIHIKIPFIRFHRNYRALHQQSSFENDVVIGNQSFLLFTGKCVNDNSVSESRSAG
jgi:hypothetical protein